MKYSLNYKNQNIELTQYCLINTSMAGQKIVFLCDNEQELAYYAFSHNFYKTNVLDSVCSYYDLYNPDGKKISNNELNSIIKNYLPIETKKIDQRKKLCDNKFVSVFMNFNKWKMVTYWIDLHKHIVKNMSQEKQLKLTHIENKSFNYIEKIELNSKIMNIEDATTFNFRSTRKI